MEKICVYTTWGPTDPTRAGLAFACAATAKKQGSDVTLFLFHDAVLLAHKDVAEKIVPIGPPPVQETLCYLQEQNVDIYVCKACYDLRGLAEADLIDHAQLKGMDVFVNLTREAKVICF